MATSFGAWEEQQEQLNVELFTKWISILFESIYYLLLKHRRELTLALTQQSCDPYDQIVIQKECNMLWNQHYLVMIV